MCALCIYLGPLTLIPVAGSVPQPIPCGPPKYPPPSIPSLKLPSILPPHPRRILFSGTTTLSTLPVKHSSPFACTSVSFLHLALETLGGGGGGEVFYFLLLAPPLSPRVRTSCVLQPYISHQETFPRASVTCENSFQTCLLETGWQMKDFFIKIRHFKEASGKKLWKPSLPLAKEKAARRPELQKEVGIQDKTVCAYWAGLLTYSQLFSPQLLLRAPLVRCLGVLLTCCYNRTGYDLWLRGWSSSR